MRFNLFDSQELVLQAVRVGVRDVWSQLDVAEALPSGDNVLAQVQAPRLLEGLDVGGGSSGGSGSPSVTTSELDDAQSRFLRRQEIGVKLSV